MNDQVVIKSDIIQFKDMQVAAIFTDYPEEIRSRLLFLRNLIFEVAAATPGVGELEETLKWGEPSYLTSKSKSGTTIRINQRNSDTEKYAFYVNCKTNLIERYKDIFPGLFQYDGTRGIIFDVHQKIPVEEVKQCISMALTYHKNKR
ncbi:MAG: DUF1801 domain-containing protein [Spirochaetes bacterium]|nr:DUF1801 domain-containing protein [Spirochaetota bacterium]